MSTRSLRHYENQGLITAKRSSTGQRLFESETVEQVRHIRMLLAAGWPTRAIVELRGCSHDPDRLQPCAVPLLVEHLRAYDERIAELLGRETLQNMIDSTPARVS